MIITKVHADGFGKLHGFELSLQEGVNLLIGPNEAGKSTLHLFLQSMLYGADERRRGGRRSVYERMRPWDTPEIYGGYLEAEDICRWRILRDFNKAPDDLTVIRLAEADGGPRSEADALTGEDAAAVLDRLLHGLSETAFSNTVSAGQLSARTERELSEELQRYAARLSTTVSPELDADAAIARLQRQREEIAAECRPDAAKDYAAVLSRIKKLEETVLNPDNENRIPSMRLRQSEAPSDAEALETRIRETNTRILQEGAALENLGFAVQADADDIGRIESAAGADYEKLQRLEKNLQSRAGIVIGWLLILAALAFAVLSWGFPLGSTTTLLLIGAGLCLVLGCLLLFTRSRRQKEAEELTGRLSEELRAHRLDGSISDAALQKFASLCAAGREHAASLAAAGEEEQRLHAKRSHLQELQIENGRMMERETEKNQQLESELTRLYQLRKEENALRLQIERNQQLAEKMEAMELAAEKLGELKESIRDTVGTYINAEASRMVEGLTAGAYGSLDAGNVSEIRLNAPDRMVSVRDVSAGTADQVYLAIRLATIRFLTGEADPLPLILDDSFSLYDDGRLSAAVRFIAEQYRGQILLFSCHNREAGALDQADIAYCLQRL